MRSFFSPFKPTNSRVVFTAIEILFWLLFGWLLLYFSRVSEIWGISLFDEINRVTLLLSLFCLFYWFWIGKNRFGRDITIYFITLLLFWISTQFTLVNIDRSRSFYVLSWVNAGEVVNSGDNLDLSKVNSDEKLSTIAIQNRLSEQYQRGYVDFKENKWILTMKGRALLAISNWLATEFKLNGWIENKM